MTTNLSGKSVIAGIGAHEIRRAAGPLHGLDERRGIRKALEDAGVEKDAVDALFVKCPTSKFELMYGQKHRRGDGPAAEDRRRVGPGRRLQHHA